MQAKKRGVVVSADKAEFWLRGVGRGDELFPQSNSVLPSCEALRVEREREKERFNSSDVTSSLEAAGLVEVRKEFFGRTPRTLFSITSEGHIAWKQHLETLQRIIDNQP